MPHSSITYTCVDLRNTV